MEFFKKLFGERKNKSAKSVMDSKEFKKAEKFFYLGKEHFESGNWKLAVENLSVFTDKYENAPDAHFLLGTAYSKLNNLEKAKMHLFKCVSLDPEHPEANYNLANTLGKLGDIDEADIYMNKAADLGNTVAIDFLAQLKKRRQIKVSYE